MLKAANRNGYASRVNILKYVKVAGKWRFAPVQTVNNKLKFDWVLIDGQPEHHTEGTYYIEWYEAGKAAAAKCEGLGGGSGAGKTQGG